LLTLTGYLRAGVLNGGLLMKVLLGHNHYVSSAPSGEDVVYHAERSLLEHNGFDVIPYERHNDEIKEGFSARFNVAREGVWSRSTYDDISRIIQSERPDVAHFHNTFPLISSSAYSACQDNGVPVIQTLNNFRLICPNGLLMRDGLPCEDCVGKFPSSSLIHGCYRNSRMATAAVVGMLSINRQRKVYDRLVNRYIAVTEFSTGRLIAGGLPSEKIVIKPNVLPEIPGFGRGEGEHAVFVGRLTEEKGVRTLIAAWQYVHDLKLIVIGSGALRGELEAEVNRLGLQVEFLGFCSRELMLETVQSARMQVVPSECYENFPMVILEAYACGTPVVASRQGSLDEIVVEGETGVKFEPRNPKDMADKINGLNSTLDAQASMRTRARKEFDEKYSQASNLCLLRKLYEDVISEGPLV